MAREFNPFDPLGLFDKAGETRAEKPIWALEPGEHGRLISKAAGLPRLPDPLGILERSNPEGKGLPQLPDPLGIFKVRKAAK